MENNTKRALSVIFAFLLLMSIFPAAVFANGSAQSGETLVAVSIAKAGNGLGSRFQVVISQYILSTFIAAMCAVIKTNGYGHGAVPIAQHIQERDDIWGYAVAAVSEAMELRNAGIYKPVMILGYVHAGGASEERQRDCIEDGCLPRAGVAGDEEKAIAEIAGA